MPQTIGGKPGFITHRALKSAIRSPKSEFAPTEWAAVKMVGIRFKRSICDQAAGSAHP